MRNRVYYDTEFWDRGTGHAPVPLSIGMVRETGGSLYLINGEAPIEEIANYRDPWLRENVLCHLPVTLKHNGLRWQARWDHAHPDADAVTHPDNLADKVREFLQTSHRLGRLELVAWYAAYDHFVLSQLFGRMIDIPSGIPDWTLDLRQEWARLGEPMGLPAQPAGLHNALADARHVLVRADWLADYADAVKVGGRE